MRAVLIALCLAFATAASAATPTVASLPVVGPTVSGGDADFLALLPTLQAAFSTVPSANAGSGFLTDAFIDGVAFDATVYFLSKNGANDDAIGIQLFADDSLHLLFPTTTGLASGDHVTVAVGTEYSIFALTHADGSGDQWSSIDFLNPDGASHIQMGYVTTDASGIWYAMALDDAFASGDRNWDDVRLAWRFSGRSIATPEPATFALLAGFLAIGAWLCRRHRLAGA